MRLQIGTKARAKASRMHNFSEGTIVEIVSYDESYGVDYGIVYVCANVADPTYTQALVDAEFELLNIEQNAQVSDTTEGASNSTAD